MKKRLLARIGTAFMAVVFAASLAGGTIPAEAATVPSVVDTSQSVSLTIHKYQKDDSITWPAADGTEIGTIPTGATPLANVQFKLYKTNIPILSDTSDISVSAADVTANPGSYGVALTTPTTTVTTDNAGTATANFDSTGQGVYYVVEVENPAVTTPATPFLVSLPMTDPLGTGWLYSVHAYPKNTTAGEPTIDKAVQGLDGWTDAAGVAVGDDVAWQITANVPADLYYLDSNSDPVYAKEFTVTDNLNANLKFVGNPAAQGSITFSDGAGSAIALIPTTDYTAALTNTGTDGQGGTLTISLTDSGKQKVAAAVEGQTDPAVNIAFETTVLPGALTVDYIENTASLTYETSTGITYTPTVPDGDIPEIHTGSGGITKFIAGTTTTLAGAKFKIAASEADARAGNFLKVVKDSAGNVTQVLPATASGEDYEVTSGADGIVKFVGLPYGSDGVSWNTATRDYWIVETAAPTGYSLIADPFSITISKNSTADTAISGTKVYDTQKFALPLTGGTGAAPFIAFGVLLIAAAVILYVRSRKSQNRA